MTQRPLVIDVVSDVICPWCYLGKHRLDKALTMVPEVAPKVRWRPFFLDPAIPPDGIERHQYLLRKFGPERLATLHQPFEEASRTEGIRYAFDKITRTPNTLNAHRLIRWSSEVSRQSQTVDALFHAYWRDGRDIGDLETLIAIAAECGLDAALIRKRMDSKQDIEDVFAEVQQAQAIGVTGVPTFILAQKYGLSGAQPPEVLAENLRRAVA